MNEMAGARLLLDAEVEEGDRSHAKYGLTGLERLLDGLRAEVWPTLVRGDRDNGTGWEFPRCGPRRAPLRRRGMVPQ